MNSTIDNFTDKLNFSKTLIAAFSVLLLTGMGAAQQSYTVNPDDDTGDYSSIQNAVEAVSEADSTITVEEGTYDENVLIANGIDGFSGDLEGLNIQAADGASPEIVFSPESATSNPSGYDAGDSGPAAMDAKNAGDLATVEIYESGVKFEGIDVTRNAASHRSDASGLETQGITVRDQGVTVKDVNINTDLGQETKNNNYGVFITRQGTSADTVTLENVEADGFEAGILVSDYYDTGISDVVLNSVTTPNHKEVGLSVYEAKGKINADAVTGSNNDFTGGSGQSILLSGASDAVSLDGPIQIEEGDSIQTAVDAAASGAKINVGSGTYTESVNVDVDGLTLEAAEDASPTIDISADSRTNIPADNVTVSGFSVVFEGQAAYVRGHNVTVEDNTFELESGTTSTGYALRYEGLTSDGEVRNNEFVGITNNQPGEFGNGVIISGADGHEVVENTFDGNSIGVNVGSQQPSRELLVSDNTFTSQDDFAVALNHDDSESPSITISSNDFNSNPIGVLALSGGDIGISSNAFTGDSDTVYVDDRANTLSLSDVLKKQGNTFDKAVTVQDSDGLVEPKIYAGIQEAVDEAESGDTVNVESGTYDESVTIDVEGLTLEGAGAGATTIVGQNGDTLATENDGAVDGVAVRGFTVEAADGSSAVDVSTAGENSDFTFSENIFVGDSEAGATVFVGGDSENMEFHDNRFEAKDGDVDKHLYLGGEATYGSGKESATSPDDAHSVTGNTFTDYKVNAVEFEGQYGEISGNTFETEEADSTAIAVPGAVAEGNSVNIDGVNVNVEKNSFDPEAVGVEANSNVESAVEAENNYWGQTSGPTDSQVSENVDYRPWRMNPIDEEGFDEVITFNDSESWSAFSVVGEVEEATTASGDAEVLGYNAGWTSPDVKDMSSVDAAFVKNTKAVGVNYVEDPGAVSRTLGEGWNLIGAYKNIDYEWSDLIEQEGIASHSPDTDQGFPLEPNEDSEFSHPQSVRNVFSPVESSIVSFQAPGEHNGDKAGLERYFNYKDYSGSILSTSNWDSNEAFNAPASIYDGYWVKASESATLSTTPEPVEEG